MHLKYNGSVYYILKFNWTRLEISSHIEIYLENISFALTFGLLFLLAAEYILKLYCIYLKYSCSLNYISEFHGIGRG